MPMLEENRRPELPAGTSGSERRQRRQMLLALALLLAALGLVLVKDKQFWFPSSATQTDAPEPAAQRPVAEQAPATSTAQPSSSLKSKAKAAAAPSSGASSGAPVDQATAGAVITASNRAVLPPLRVEVVAGDQHRTIEPGNPAIRVELQPRGSSDLTSGPASAEGNASTQSNDTVGTSTNASAEVHLSPGTEQILSHPVDPMYPLLAKQMKVQGSVVLQALIGKQGNIQDLQVLSGPAILSAAAREAVKQWRFKPYLQSGQPVETEAKITVNFTISTQ